MAADSPSLSQPDRMLAAAREALDAATLAADHPARVAAEVALAEARAIGPEGDQFRHAREALRLAQTALGVD